MTVPLTETYAQLAHAAVAGAVTGRCLPRVGTDVQAVSAVAESLDGPLRDAYLARLFTAGEVADSGGRHAAAADSLAARFAAKEAVLKVLAPAAGVPQPPWTDIEVRREPSGRPSLHLHGAAAAHARAERLTAFTCSLAHDGGVAVATVIALQELPPAPTSGATSERLTHDDR